MSANILIYGNDPTLLLTRRLILQQSGFNVMATSEFEHAVSVAINGQIDLLILCQTLRRRERQGVLETARAVKPTMKKLILDSTVAPSHLLDDEEVVDGFFNHETLLTTVNRTLFVEAV